MLIDQFSSFMLQKKNTLVVILLYIITITWLGFILYTQPAQGYEISIYAAYSSLFWTLFIFTVFLSIISTTYFIIRKNPFWKYCIPAIIIVDIITIFLHLIRGYEYYALGSSDIFAHLAWTNYIVNNGHIIKDVHYPVSHILTAILEQSSLLDPRVLSSLLSSVFFIIYLLSLFILGKIVFKSNKSGAIIFLCGTPLFFSSTLIAFYPFLYAIFFFPIIFYVIFKIIGGHIEHSDNYRICFLCLFIPLVFFIVFCHPLVSLFLLSILGIIGGYVYLCKKYNFLFCKKSTISGLITIVGIIFIFWYIQFQSILDSGKNVVSGLLGEVKKETIISYNTNFFGRLEIPWIRIFEGFIKVYGPTVIYGAMAILFSIYIVKSFISKKSYLWDLIYVTIFLLSLIIGLMLILGNFIIFEFHRATSFFMIMSTIICGIGINRFIQLSDSSRKICLLIFIFATILSSVSILSIFTVYHSPWKFEAGKHISTMEIRGFNFHLSKSDESLPIFGYLSLRKYSMYINEQYDASSKNQYYQNYNIPPFFGYEVNNHFIDNLGYLKKMNFYLITTERMRKLYLAYIEEVRQKNTIYPLEVFSRLQNDDSIVKLYSNSEFEIYMSNVYSGGT